MSEDLEALKRFGWTIEAPTFWGEYLPTAEQLAFFETLSVPRLVELRQSSYGNLCPFCLADEPDHSPHEPGCTLERLLDEADARGEHLWNGPDGECLICFARPYKRSK